MHKKLAAAIERESRMPVASLAEWFAYDPDTGVISWKKPVAAPSLATKPDIWCLQLVTVKSASRKRRPPQAVSHMRCTSANGPNHS